MREALGRGLAANEGFWNSISTEFHLTAAELKKSRQQSQKNSESEKQRQSWKSFQIKETCQQTKKDSKFEHMTLQIYLGQRTLIRGNLV